MSKKSITCYYSALDPEKQTYESKIPNIDEISPYQEGYIYMQTNKLFNDNNDEVGILKTDATQYTYDDNVLYENRIWTVFFYGSVSFPITITGKNDTSFFKPGDYYKMPILYCSGNDIYNQTGTVEIFVYDNDAKSRSITINFD
jgi:hypothetical protein